MTETLTQDESSPSITLGKTTQNQLKVLLVVPTTELIAGHELVGSIVFSLLQSLSKKDFNVSLLLLDHGRLHQSEISQFISRSEESGFNLRYLVRDKYPHFVGPKAACNSYVFYQWLRENDDFDVVHAPDLFGITYYAQLAKSQGLAFSETKFVLALFGTSSWRDKVNQTFTTSPESLALDYLEKRSLALADAVFSLDSNLALAENLGLELPDSQYGLCLTPALQSHDLLRSSQELAENILQIAQEQKDICPNLSLTALHEDWWRSAHQSIFQPASNTSQDLQFEDSTAIPKSSGADAAFSSKQESKGTQETLPMVTVCMAHYNRPAFLRAALQSLMQQDYAPLEVLVGDDGSDLENVQLELTELEGEIKERGWKILRLEHRGVGATRTKLAEAAKGEYLLFMDDDNLAMPHEISTLMRVCSKSNADIVTCCFNAFEDQQDLAINQKSSLVSDANLPVNANNKYCTSYTKVFLGSAPECGLTENIFGDTNSLIKKSVYFELGGFDNSIGTAWHDWVFFAKATLSGKKLDLVPEPLFWYRLTANSMNRSSTQWLSAQPLLKQYQDFFPTLLQELPNLIFSLNRRIIELETQIENAKLGESINHVLTDHDLTDHVLINHDSTNETSTNNSAEKLGSEFLTDSRSQISSQSQPEAARPNENSIALKSHVKIYLLQAIARFVPELSPGRRAIVILVWKFFTLRVLKQIIAEHKRAAEISSSPLFDAQWYRNRYHLDASGTLETLGRKSNPAYHYISQGARLGYEPNSNFDSIWYGERYKNDLENGLTPLEHYIQQGQAKNYLAHPSEHELFKDFDSSWYLNRNQDLTGLSETKVMPFLHYVSYGAAEGRAPNRESEKDFSIFDAEWYSRQYLDFSDDPILKQDPFLHYAIYGRKEGKSPNRAEYERLNFNANWYLARYPELKILEENAFEHYLNFGKQEGRFGRPEDDPEASGFDESFYCERYRDLADCGIPPLLHYLLYGRKEGRLKKPVDGPGSAAHLIKKRFKSTSPLPVFAVPKSPKRVNVVFEFESQFPSNSPNKKRSSKDLILNHPRSSALIFSAVLAEKLDAILNLIIYSEPFELSELDKFFQFHSLPFPNNMQISFDKSDESSNFRLASSFDDLFITTCWRSTERALRSVPAERISYFIQNDERLENGDKEDYLRCSEILKNERIRFIIDSKLLKQNLCKNGFEHIALQGISFEPVISKSFKPMPQKEDPSNNYSNRAGEKKNFVFYARPQESKYLYYRGIEVIIRAIERAILTKAEWNIYFAAENIQNIENIPDITLPNSIKPIMVNLASGFIEPDYVNLLNQMDLGLSLILSPHPGYITLQMAASGAVVITNQYENKKSLRSTCENIICVEPSVVALVEALASGVALTNEPRLRLEHYRKNSIERDWHSSFNSVLLR
jgi:glycosyltransferase involved in cell wall biosynthesis